VANAKNALHFSQRGITQKRTEQNQQFTILENFYLYHKNYIIDIQPIKQPNWKTLQIVDNFFDKYFAELKNIIRFAQTFK
jgi:hypothetical protein